MRKATVVYVTGGEGASGELYDPEAAIALGLEPKWTVVTSSGAGAFELNDAARRFIQQGAHLVEAQRAELARDGSLRACGAPTRLFG